MTGDSAFFILYSLYPLNLKRACVIIILNSLKKLVH